MRLFFYDHASIEREFGPYGLTEVVPLDEPQHDGSLRPFLHVVCAPK